MSKPMDYSELSVPMLYDLYSFYKERQDHYNPHLNILAGDYGVQAELVLQAIYNRDCPVPM